MPRRPLLALLCLLSLSLHAAQAPADAPPRPLLEQVQRLSELLRDSYAVWYPEATQVRLLQAEGGEELALVVFTVEGFAGGNNHTQYLAAFAADADPQGQAHFSLIDVLPVAGKGWRAITEFAPQVSRDAGRNELSIAIDALEVTAGDSPNFPSQKTTVHLALKDGRLVERRSP
jgi:hypothetical protein